jgi:Zn ribbon nucleic-acid-binding protein
VSGVAALGMLYFRSQYFTNQRVIREQPVQFSHAHHVGGLGIDCRYCHFSVENSAFAGIPPTKVCMNCHSQIWNDSPYLEPVRASFRNDQPLQWVRIHNLPDHAYFNHSIHVNKGISCATCHGRVDKMALMWQEESLQMKWCLDCHRDPEQFIGPKDKVFDPEFVATDRELSSKLAKELNVQKKTSCSTCHR